MKYIYVWILATFIVICTCILIYQYGYTTGQASCPVKYAVCENGTCVLSDKPPDYTGK
jgi:hypothetical protein